MKYLMKYVNRRFNSFMDWYVNYALVKDFAFVGIVWLTVTKVSLIPFTLASKENQVNILSNLISAAVSLAGFLIAALTILITYKLTIKAKTYDEATSPSEMIFVGKHYYNMMAVFRDAIIELLILCLGLYILWASSDNFDAVIINRIVISGILLAVLPIFRSLMLLFRLLSLDKRVDQNHYNLVEED